MNHVLTAILGSMHADMARLESAGMNLANVQTPAYKRDVVSAMSFASHLEGSTTGPDAKAASSLRVHTDMRAGTLKATGHALDVAIVGDGWFEVATERGPTYTRQGTFRLDGRGRLVTQQGDPVMGTAGEIQLLHGAPVVDAAGRVFESGNARGAGSLGAAPMAQLKVVQFDTGTVMTRLGDGLFGTTADGVAALDGAIQVQQGFLENSNVSHMHEMVKLMESVRHLESIQRAAVAYDEMLGTSIRRLGEQ